jgi:hypothetical protein
MKNLKFIATLFAGVTLVAAPAFAQTSVSVTASAGVGSTTVSASTQTKITNAKSHANQEIMRRTNILTQLNTSVQAMVNVSASEKSAIATEVQTEISNLTTLNATIQADTTVAQLKTDITSIATDYRIFMLVVPQGRIEVAADKIQTVASNYTAISTKLQTRISQAPSGTNTTQVNAWLSDMNTQVTNANTQAAAAISLVANLQPDQGNATIEASNKTALQSARADIKTALADLKTARQDAGSIVKTVESWGGSTSAAVSASTTVNTQ